MKNRNLNKLSLVVCAASVLSIFVTSQVFAAGFEKSVFWSGHYSALAGAAQSSVTGPEALYWNPAGLAGSEGLQISGDFSPTLSKFNGNVTQAGSQTTTASVSSNTSFSPVGAAFISYGLTPQWAWGVGYDVVGGTRADYDSVNLGFPSATGLSLTPPLKADLTITELSLGTGYEVMPGFKIGASYRLTFVHADLDVATGGTFQGGGTNYYLTSIQLAGLSQSAWNGFRVGAEWAPKDSPFGFGAVWRSRVNFNATGGSTVITNVNGPATGGTPTTTTTTGSANVGGTLPMRFDTAAHYVVNPAWTGFLGYTFTNYAQDQALNFNSSATTVGGQSTNGSVPLVWNNMHNIRAAVEYNGIDGTPIRFGYVWTSQVTPAGDASPVLASPGTGNTFILGTSHKCTPNLTVDAAFEYSRDSGSVAASDLNQSSLTTATGDYSAKAYALHLGATLAL
jgi:long-chain fatty acid transport protein